MTVPDKPNRLPWENQPYIDHKAATEQAIAAAQSCRVDPNGAPVESYAQKAFDEETGKVRDAVSGTRNDALFKAAAALFEIVAAGALDETAVFNAMMDACRTNELIRDDGEHSVTQTIKSARRRGLDNPRDLSHVGTKVNGFTLDSEPVQSVKLETVFDAERGFWTQRDSLQSIYLAALARMCSPWAVLGHCAARALALVRPNATLPPLIGGPGSLNWFCAIAAPSGGGKGSAASVAKELMDEFVLQRSLGSGEGIIDAYVIPANKETGEPKALHESVMFTADEIDTMHVLSQRSGATLPSILRSGFSGETLGFSYRTSSDLHLQAHTYRMTLVVSVQPAKAGALMDDAHGGTLQRFMWFPGIDLRISSDIPLMPASLELPSPVAWQFPRQLAIPYEATELIRDERTRAMRGEQDHIDGHALFIREKFAYALAVLDGRDVMSSEDWRLSGIASRVSDHTRTWVGAQLVEIADEQASERGRLQGVSATAADEEKTFRASQRLTRIGSWALKKIANHQKLSDRDLARAVASRDRGYLPAALDMLRNSGLIEQDNQKRWVKVDG